MSKIYLVIICNLILLFCNIEASYGQQSMKTELCNFVNDKLFNNASIGISVVDVKTGDKLAKYRADKSMTAASLLKLLTTATVLMQKGGKYKRKTNIYYLGKLKDNALEGDLYIQGNGDPTFNSRYFPINDAVTKVVKMVKNKNIKTIHGDLILNNSLFSANIPKTWAWEDISNYYGTLYYPINYNDNLYKLTFWSGLAGEQTKIIDLSPNQNLSFKNEVKSSIENRDNAYIYGSILSDKRIVRGTIPENRSHFSIKGAMPNPAEQFGNAIIRKFESENIDFIGQIKISKKPLTRKFVLLGTILSPNLAKIITATNQKSINLFAEALLYWVEADNHYSREEHLKALQQYWEGKGLFTRGLFLYDGSGLSHFNAVPPSFFTDLLVFMANHKESDTFKKTLAVSGQSGTLRKLGKNTSLEGMVLGKSGTMKQVNCCAGYLTTQNGRELAFSIMVNNCLAKNKVISTKISDLLLSFYEKY